MCTIGVLTETRLFKALSSVNDLRDKMTSKTKLIINHLDFHAANKAHNHRKICGE